jgi:hypothetical protein
MGSGHRLARPAWWDDLGVLKPLLVLGLRAVSTERLLFFETRALLSGTWHPLQCQFEIPTPSNGGHHGSIRNNEGR